MNDPCEENIRLELENRALKLECQKLREQLEGKRRGVDFGQVARASARQFGLGVEHLLARGGSSAQTTRARECFIYCLKELHPHLSWNEMRRIAQRGDHSTCVKAYQRAEKRISSDATFSERVDAVLHACGYGGYGEGGEQ